MAKRSKKKQAASRDLRVKTGPASPDLLGADWLWAALLIIATLLAYQAVWSAKFIWDDTVNVTANATLRSSHGLWQIWFEPGATQQYYPLTYTLFWIEYHVWELNPLGYHLDNVFLHIGSALLLWKILRRLGVHGAWLAAAIFALHPVGVDSVACVTERKNTLSGLFFLGSILAAVEFWNLGRDESEANKEQVSAPQWKFYGLALFLYLCALASKTAAVPLPMVLLLLLWWRRPRLERRDLVLLVPFFVVGLAMGLMTIWVEKHYAGTIGAEWAFSWPDRFILVGKQVCFYLAKLIWPWPLIAVYPRWSVDAGQALMYLPLAFAAIALAFLAFKRNTRWQPVFVGAIYFILLLLPTTALFSQFYFRYSFVADHFQYLASIGPLTLAALGIVYTLDLFRAGNSWLKPIVCGVVLVALGTLTWFHAWTYVDSETLWRTTLAQNPTCWLANDSLGYDLAGKGRIPEAMEQFEQAVRLNPGSAQAHSNLGVAQSKTDQAGEAISEFEQALKLEPDDADTRFNFGNALMQTGRSSEAISQFEQALQLKPDSAGMHNNLGLALRQMGQLPEAAEQLREVVRLRPDDAGAHNNLGSILQQEGKSAEAIEEFQRALRINPASADAHFNLGNALLQAARPNEAVNEFQQALNFDPNNADAHNNLGNALLQSGQPKEAMDQFQQALVLKPGDAGAHNNLGSVLRQQGRLSEAIEEFQMALRINPHDTEAGNNLKSTEALLNAPLAPK